ncbi:MAG TPA: hypothetical protein VLC98_06015 [Phnomibacter sp.]|nr:hypothetical protein [Phnomibacter sp.]
MKKISIASLLSAALLVGTLDIIAACLQFYIKTQKGPAPVLKFIASGVFGKAAFSSGNSMIFYGLAFHYIIALLFTVFFFFMVSQFPKMLQRPIITGILFGAFVWVVMNLLVLPLSNTNKGPIVVSAAITGMLILMVCIGIPLALIAARKIKKGDV